MHIRLGDRAIIYRWGVSFRLRGKWIVFHPHNRAPLSWSHLHDPAVRWWVIGPMRLTVRPLRHVS